MRIENTTFNSIKASSVMKKSTAVIDEDAIKSILYLGVRMDLPAAENKRTVDIFI